MECKDFKLQWVIFDDSPCSRCKNWFFNGCVKGHLFKIVPDARKFLGRGNLYPKECRDFELSLGQKLNPAGVNKKRFQKGIGKIKKYFRESQ